MKDQKDYLRDISEIRSMMERSSKCLSLAGWAGIMAGIYALAGAYLVQNVFGITPEVLGNYSFPVSTDTSGLVWTGIGMFVLAIGTAVYFSAGKATRRGEKLWNATSRRLLIQMSVPLLAGGLVVFVLMLQGFIGLVAPFTLIFYGLALYNAGNFTYREIQFLGLLEILLGIFAACFIPYGLYFWAAGFGLLHIAYGIYIHFKYER